jgi:hypothetical protein
LERQPPEKEIAMKDRYLVFKLFIILLLMVAGMTVDYHSQLAWEEANKKNSPYDLFCLPPNTVFAGGGR